METRNQQKTETIGSLKTELATEKRLKEAFYNLGNRYFDLWKKTDELNTRERKYLRHELEEALLFLLEVNFDRPIEEMTDVEKVHRLVNYVNNLYAFILCKGRDLTDEFMDWHKANNRDLTEPIGFEKCQEILKKYFLSRQEQQTDSSLN